MDDVIDGDGGEVFGEYPISLAEAKADKERNGSFWTPRDALISILRSIDNGEINPDALVCFVSDVGENGQHSTRFYNASPDNYTCLGLIEMGKFKILSFV